MWGEAAGKYFATGEESVGPLQASISSQARTPLGS
jgi:hypothetical protein